MSDKYEIKDRIQAFMSMLAKYTPDARNAEYAVFAHSLMLLEKAFDRANRRDPETGNVLPVTEEQLKNLRNAYGNAMKSAETYLKTASSKKSDTFRKEIVGNIRDMLFADSGHLINAEADGIVTLKDMLEGTRTQVVDLGDAALDKVGANMSVRMPVKYTDDKGNTYEGFFTEESVVPSMEEAMKGPYEKLKKDYPQYYDVIHDFAKKANPANLSMFVGDLKTPIEIAKDALATMLAPHARSQEKALELAGNPEFMHALRDFAGYGGNAGNAVMIFDSILKLRPGENIDNRNAAMSVVADLIGCPDVIARSKPMKLIIGGREIIGTFMETARGKDIMNLDHNDPALNYTKESFDNPRVNRKMCDLQILDHICGNIDRHAGNIFYQFDENGKITDITGIDNDASFPKDIKDPSRALAENMATLNNDTAVSEKTANQIMNLTDEMLRIALRGTKLDEESIDFAVQRLHQVKERIISDIEYFKDKSPTLIEKGHIHIIKDEDWEKIPLTELALSDAGKQALQKGEEISARGGVVNSPLGRLYNLDKYMEDNYKANHRPENYQKKEAPQGRLVRNEAVQYHEADPMGNFVKDKAVNSNELRLLAAAMEAHDPFYIKSSDEYRNVKSELMNLTRLVGRINENTNEDQLNSIRESYTRLAEKAEVYLEKKAGETGLSDLANNRMTAVSEVLLAARNGAGKLNKALNVVPETNLEAAERITAGYKTTLNAELAKPRPNANTLSECISKALYVELLRKSPNSRFNEVRFENAVKKMQSSKQVKDILKNPGAKEYCIDLMSQNGPGALNGFKNVISQEKTESIIVESQDKRLVGDNRNKAENPDENNIDENRISNNGNKQESKEAFENVL